MILSGFYKNTIVLALIRFNDIKDDQKDLTQSLNCSSAQLVSVLIGQFPMIIDNKVCPQSTYPSARAAGSMS